MLNALLVSQVVLLLLVVALGVVVFALTRQIGVLHERIAPAGALMVAGGPKVGEAAPGMEVTDIEGRTIPIGGQADDGRSRLIFFLSPTCPVCKTLLPVLKSAQKSERDWLEIQLASDGDLAEHRRFFSDAGLDSFTYLLSSALGRGYQVGKLPFAVLIDELGIIRSKGLVNSREHLESLFEAKNRGVASIQEYFSKADH
ncbi:MAG TPA: methylamine dehydrogenase accessory protein MauD [Woeseiaceae bacterium]|nr:methylamine dehydrogenase accessory protein MauD [Woeseiaceae bacterium]